MNNKLLLTTLCGTLPGLGAAQAQTPTSATKPNVIIIYTDDMGIGDVSFANNHWVLTPNIDRLAAEGMVMNHYYSAAPVSSPSRVGITTGMFPLQWGINTFLQERRGNAACEQFDFLSASAPSMARSFKAAGYHTGHFGKWHMGGGRDVYNAPSIPSFGFDEYASTWESPDPDPQITGDSTWIWSDKDPVKRWNRTAYFVDKTLDFLARHKGEPCFVNLWPDDMHTPWVYGPEAMIDKKGWSTPPNFDKVLVEYDRQIGRFLDKLKEMELEENTIVIFTSDNGPSPSFEQQRTNMQRGCKNSLYEGGIHMPFVIRWPGHIAPGTVDDQTVICSVDLFPSLCAIVGAPLPDDYQLSGEDLSTALTGTPQTRQKDLMWDFGRNSHFNRPPGANRSPHLAIRRGDWKLLMNASGEQVELYNVVEDPNEAQNVAADHPKMVQDLSIAVLKWWDGRRLPGRK